MKKVLLPLLLLVAISCLIAVESAPSAIVGYVKYPCVTTGAGSQNMVALPMEQGYTTSSEVGIAYAGQVNSVIEWVAEFQSWNSCDWYPDFEIWDPEFPVAAGKGLVVNAVSAFDFYSMGTVPAPTTYPLLVGQNMCMVPLDRSDLVSSDLVGIDIPSSSSIIEWLSEFQSWNSCDWYPDFEIWDPVFTTSIGKPIMVNSLSDASWPSGAKGVKSLKASRASK